MKLRIQEQSITLRLQTEEVHVLAQQNSLNQVTPLPGNNLMVELEIKQIDDLELKFSDQTLQFSFPEAWVAQWTHSSKVGYSRIIESLTVTVEKDMPRKRSNG